MIHPRQNTTFWRTGGSLLRGDAALIDRQPKAGGIQVSLSRDQTWDRRYRVARPYRCSDSYSCSRLHSHSGIRHDTILEVSVPGRCVQAKTGFRGEMLYQIIFTVDSRKQLVFSAEKKLAHLVSQSVTSVGSVTRHVVKFQTTTTTLSDAACCRGTTQEQKSESR